MSFTSNFDVAAFSTRPTNISLQKTISASRRSRYLDVPNFFHG
jgi:hypothetical protein